MTAESNLLANIRLEHSKGPTRLFRNNQGLGWVGKIAKQTPTHITLYEYRPLHAGLVIGASDLIGWTRREQRAIFTAIEVKGPRGVLSEDQQRFLDAVLAAGGIAGVARSADEVARIIGGAR